MSAASPSTSSIAQCNNMHSTKKTTSTINYRNIEFKSNLKDNSQSNHHNQSNNTTPQKLTLKRANAPTLSIPITPFQSSGSKSAARTSAIFYTQCHINGVSSKEADDAALDSKKAYKDWWKQERFTSSIGGVTEKENDDEDGSIVSKQILRKKRRFKEIHHKLPSSSSSTTTFRKNFAVVVSEDDDVDASQQQQPTPIAQIKSDNSTSINDNIGRVKSS